jgi:hypothetical protein
VHGDIVTEALNFIVQKYLHFLQLPLTATELEVAGNPVNTEKPFDSDKRSDAMIDRPEFGMTVQGERGTDTRHLTPLTHKQKTPAQVFL